MNAIEKLRWLQENTVHVDISFNEHRVYYEPLEDFLNDTDRNGGLFDEEEDAPLRKACLARDQLVVVQVYPTTPIGFYRVGHFDFESAIDAVYDAVKAEKDRTTSPPTSTKDTVE